MPLNKQCPDHHEYFLSVPNRAGAKIAKDAKSTKKQNDFISAFAIFASS